MRHMKYMVNMEELRAMGKSPRDSQSKQRPWALEHMKQGLALRLPKSTRKEEGPSN